MRAQYLKPGRPLRVGLSWRSTSQIAGNRKTTNLLDWRDILNTEGVQFVNLQYGDCAADLASVKNSLGIEIIQDAEIDPLVDLDGFAAQVAALDLVISTPNTTVHFAGAQGVPVWVMLPVAPEWRWLRAGTATPWYPSATL